MIVKCMFSEIKLIDIYYYVYFNNCTGLITIKKLNWQFNLQKLCMKGCFEYVEYLT